MAEVNLYVSLCALIFLKFISTAELQESPNHPQTRRRTVSDPVSNFFSGLGDVFLDIDRTVAVQTAPKVDYENGLMSQLLGPLQPRKENFERVQDNYKSIQERLGAIIADAISPRQNNAGRRIDPLTSILFPDRKSEAEEKKTSKSLKQSQSRRPLLNSEEIRSTMERLLADTRRTGEFLGSLESLKPLRDVSSMLTRRSGDSLESGDKSDQEKAIGDNSESRFDQYIRQLLQNHGKWVLDNPLLKGWQSSSSRNAVEETSEQLPVENEVISTESTSTEAELIEATESMARSGNQLPEESFEKPSEELPSMSANYYNIADDGEIINEVDIVLQPETIPESEMADAQVEETEQEIEQEEEELEPKDTLILAFTNDGVPLKLRMGPEVLNPVKFLHRILRKAGVTLKVPVESYEDLEPVGKEVLLLGAGSGIITRAVYLDLSNPNELRSLLRTLKSSKVLERSKY